MITSKTEAKAVKLRIYENKRIAVEESEAVKAEKGFVRCIIK